MARIVEGIHLKIDTSEMQTKFVKAMKEANKQMPDFIDSIVSQMAESAIDYAIPLTRVRTGRLRSSYRMSDIYRSRNRSMIAVYNYASDNGGKYSYAGYNEFGTSFMAPRLMLTTARERVIQESPEIFKTAFVRMVRGDISGRYTYKLD